MLGKEDLLLHECGRLFWPTTLVKHLFIRPYLGHSAFVRLSYIGTSGLIWAVPQMQEILISYVGTGALLGRLFVYRANPTRRGVTLFESTPRRALTDYCPTFGGLGAFHFP